MSEKAERKRLWVDPPFQSRLLARLGIYLLAFTVLVIHLGFILELMGRVAQRGDREGIDTMYVEYLDKQRALLISLVLFAPLLIYDLLKFSHRIAGPLLRCRKVMEEMAQGKAVPEFKPRKRDLLGDLFAAFNALIRTCNSRAAPSTNGHADHASAVLPEAKRERPAPAPRLPTSAEHPRCE